MEIIDQSGQYKYFFDKDQELNLQIKKDCQLIIDCVNCKLNLSFEILNSSVKINFLNQNKVNINQKIKLTNSALYLKKLNLVEQTKIKSKIALYQSTIDFQHAVYTKEKTHHELIINHYTLDCHSKINCLGIGREKADIAFLVTTKINKKGKNNTAFQNSKIIALDETVQANLSPILKTDYHQIKASHAAVFSKITPQEIYYLQARGLSEKQAKDLIVKSLLVRGNEQYYEKIEEVIK